MSLRVRASAKACSGPLGGGDTRADADVDGCRRIVCVSQSSPMPSPEVPLREDAARCCHIDTLLCINTRFFFHMLSSYDDSRQGR